MRTISDFKNSNSIKNESTSSEKNVTSMFSKLFESRDFAHYAHLKSKSYAEHKALGSFYEEIIELADTFYETYAGQYGQVSFNLSSTPKDSNVISYMENLGKTLADGHSLLEKNDTHLHNILDEIVGLIYQTCYKLKYLK
jgi:hypothetical protein